MILGLLFGMMISNASLQSDSLASLHKKLSLVLERSLGYPSEAAFNRDTCFHYVELFKIEIDRNSNASAIRFSDSAPDWLKRYFITPPNNSRPTWIKEIEEIVRASKFKSCTLLFPVTLEAETFPCGSASKERKLSPNYFQFDGKNIEGKNVIFGDNIQIEYSKAVYWR